MDSVTAIPVISPAANSSADDHHVAFDHPDLASRYLRGDERRGDGGVTHRQVVIQLENVRCAGCCGAVEHALARLVGMLGAEVNYTTHQLRVSWDPHRLELSTVLRTLETLGYPGQPLCADSRGDVLARQRRELLKRFGVAAAFGMQIMVLSVCLYTGRWWGIEADLARLFRNLSLLLVLPVMLYSAAPFFAAAWRDLGARKVGMDVPVSLGLGIAFLASLYSLAVSGQEVYFDSIAMFVFLILGSRLIESSHRLRAVNAVAVYDAVLPASARRWSDAAGWRYVPAASLVPGDRVSIEAGDVVPADGVITGGQSSFDESLLTGESMPLIREAGAAVMAGSVNVEHPVEFRVTASGEQTEVSALARLVQKASFEKPQTSLLVEQLAGWFVLSVLSIAMLVAATGYILESPVWLSSTIAVLIVSCPCALALATPTALSVAMGQAQKLGVLVTNGTALEEFDRVNHFFFDKTGTLTTGLFEVRSVDFLRNAQSGKSIDQESMYAVVRALESYSRHPVAVALKKLADDRASASVLAVTAGPAVSDVCSVAGGGISGSVEGRFYYLGTSAFVRSSTHNTFVVPEPGDGTIAVLADAEGVICIFTLRDQLRDGALALVKELKSRQCEITILSGDQQSAVEKTAHELDVTHFHSGCSPDEKLKIVTHFSQSGVVTAMLGDGVNDAAVVSRVDVAVAVGQKVNLTTVSADLILLSSSLERVVDTLRLSRKLRSIIRQNLGWALGYNLIAIPFAALGMVPPWLAAIGMSLSSLLVVLNASRLSRHRVSG